MKNERLNDRENECVEDITKLSRMKVSNVKKAKKWKLKLHATFHFHFGIIYDGWEA